MNKGSASPLQACKAGYPESDLSLPLGSHLFHPIKAGGRGLTSPQSPRLPGLERAAGMGEMHGPSSQTGPGGTAGLGGSRALLEAHALI